MMKMIPIEYLGFWDVPRNFLVRFAGQLYLFDCPFDDDLDDYPEAYAVYVLSEMSREKIDEGWAGLPAKALHKVGILPIASVRFDPTKRQEIGAEAFELLAANAPSANGAMAHGEAPVRIS